MENRGKPMAYAALILGALIIGSSAIWMRLAAVPGPVSSFYRMSIGSLTLTIPFLYQKRKLNLDKKSLLLAIFAGVFFGLDIAAWSTGVMISGATIPTLMSNLAPVWVGFGTLIFFRKKLRTNFWLGLAIALLGASSILGIDLFAGFKLDIGALYGILAAVFYGGFFLFAERSREKLDPLSFFWVSVTTSSIVLFFLTKALSQPLLGYDRQTYWIFIIMGILVQALGWFSINYAQGHLPASLVSPSLLAQPVFTAIFAILFLGESLAPLQVLGGIAVLVGVYIVHSSKNTIDSPFNK